LTKDQRRAACINSAATFVLPVLLYSIRHNSGGTTWCPEQHSTRLRNSLGRA